MGRACKSTRIAGLLSRPRESIEALIVQTIIPMISFHVDGNPFWGKRERRERGSNSTNTVLVKISQFLNCILERFGQL